MLAWLFRFFNGISQSIRAARLRRQRQRNVQNANDDSRQVVEYSSIPIETFFDYRALSVNTLISGSNTELRNRVICACAWNAVQQMMPVVILHCADRNLENAISSTFDNRSNVSIINSSNSIYDPLHGLSTREVSTIVLAGSRGKFEIKNSGGTYIDAISEYITAAGHTPNLRMFIECDHLEFPSRVTNAVASGLIDRAQSERIQRLLLNGQVEKANVENFFKELAKQSQCVIATDEDVERRTNIQTAVSNNGIIMLDMISGGNNLFFNFVFQEIRDAMSRGQRFMLVLDSIPMNSCESLKELLENFSGNCRLVFSANDVFAEFPNQLFDTMIGRFEKVVVSRHSSGISCKKFETFFGSYLRQELTTTFSDSTSRQTFGQILPGSTSSDTQSITTRYDPRVSEQTITGMGDNEAFIRNSENSEIVHLRNISHGVPWQIYERPRRTSNVASRTRFNIGVFIILIIVFFPAAFIYAARTVRVGLRWLFVVLAVLSCLALVIWWYQMLTNI